MAKRALVVPDGIEPVLGWRSWRVATIEGEVRLKSVNRAYTWTPRHENRAECTVVRETVKLPSFLALFTDGRGKGRKPHEIDDSTGLKVIPTKDCVCGFYAARSHAQLVELSDPRDEGGLGYHYLNPRQQYGKEFVEPRVAGVVAMWGHICEHVQGWRVEFAYPRIIFVPMGCGHLIQPLREAYGVRVKMARSLKQLPMSPEQAESESEAWK